MPYATNFRPRQAPRGHTVARGTQDFGQIIAADNLLAVWRLLSQEGGQAPGPDGIHYSDLGLSEVCQILRQLSCVLRSDPSQYLPGVARLVRIPKGSGGFRTLSLRSVFDRVVAKAVQAALQDSLERVYLPCSFGFRRQLSRLDLLAHLAAEIRRTGRTVLTQDDVTTAFDSVHTDLVTADLQQHVQDQRLRQLIRAILHGDNPTQTVGIDQGGALSPDALNIHLHHRLDTLLLHGGANPVYVRYADNVAWLTKTITEGRDTHQRIQELLLESCSLRLKSTQNNEGRYGTPVDLAKTPANLLGFQVRLRQGELHCNLEEGAWRELQETLDECHNEPYSTLRAQQVLQGWIQAHGPVFRAAGRQHYCRQFISILRRTRFPEVQEHCLISSMTRAHNEWLQRLSQGNHQRGARRHGGLAARTQGHRMISQ